MLFLMKDGFDKKLIMKFDKTLNKVKLATVVEDDQKVAFLIATTPRCRVERHSIPWIAPLYLWSVPYNAEC